MSNLGAGCHLGFDRKWIFTVSLLSEINTAAVWRQRVINDSTRFTCPLFSGRNSHPVSQRWRDWTTL